MQIYLDNQAAGATVANQKPQETFTIGSAPNPRLRVIKVASTPIAEPGDEVSFTIRFDNVGNQPIGSVQIVDSLTTRLEYVSGSAQCSRPAQFATQPNEGESLVVRCLLSDPLPPGKGGVFRFRCIVRVALERGDSSPLWFAVQRLCIFFSTTRQNFNSVRRSAEEAHPRRHHIFAPRSRLHALPTGHPLTITYGV